MSYIIWVNFRPVRFLAPSAKLAYTRLIGVISMWVGLWLVQGDIFLGDCSSMYVQRMGTLISVFVIVLLASKLVTRKSAGMFFFFLFKVFDGPSSMLGERSHRLLDVCWMRRVRMGAGHSFIGALSLNPIRLSHSPNVVGKLNCWLSGFRSVYDRGACLRI